MREEPIFYHDGCWYYQSGAIEITMRDGTNEMQRNYVWAIKDGRVRIETFAGADRGEAAAGVQEAYQAWLVNRIMMA